MNLKNRAIIAIMLIIVGMSGVYLYWGITRYQLRMETKISETVARTGQLIQEIQKYTNNVYKARIESLLENETILKAFNDRDRERLYASVLPRHEALKKENPHYSNMHFHLPDAVSFLRMHKPEEFGDDLSELRPIIMNVHRSRQPCTGYEIGKHGLFYRVVNPVFYHGRYIGILEFGIEVEEFVQNIEKVMAVNVARYIHDSLLNPAFRKYCTNELIVGPYSLNPFFSRKLFDRLAPDYDFNRHVPQRQVMDKRHYVLYSAGNLRDFNGEAIARFLIVHEITGEMATYMSFVGRSFLLTIVLIVAAFFVLNLSFGSMISRIVDLNRTLEQKVRERTRDLEMISYRFQQANLELDQIFNTSAAGMRVIGRDFRVLRVNDTFCELIGRPRRELEGRACHEWFRGDFCFRPECTLTRILNGESRIEMDVKKETSPGVVKSFLLTAVPFTSPDGDIIGVVESFRDVTEREKAAQALRESEEYQKTIMDTVHDGVVVIDAESQRIIDANPYAAELIGRSRKSLVDRQVTEFFSLPPNWINTFFIENFPSRVGTCIVWSRHGKEKIVRLTAAPATLEDRILLVLSFVDITDMNRLLEKQVVDIHKAKHILKLVNPEGTGYCDLSDQRRLYCCAVSIPCNAEGGDHFFIHHQKGPPAGSRRKTVVSLKDQSGHEVNCILRSIYTDIVHHDAAGSSFDRSAGDVFTELNNRLYRSGIFERDEFFTSITLELDHQTLGLTYISAAHPPFLLVREGIVSAVPEKDEGKGNLPVPFLEDSRYGAGSIQLEDGDQLVLYTDGLTEMPFRNTGRCLSTPDLTAIAQAIVDQDGACSEGRATRYLPVNRLTRKILEKVAAMSRETVVDLGLNQGGKNTSMDDVTILGLELESDRDALVLTLYPDGAAGLSEGINNAVETILQGLDRQSGAALEARLRLVLEEAVINAWKHGNRKDPAKSITVRWRSANEFILEVIDRGKGFDYDTLPDPTQDSTILDSEGRGIFIINQFSDRIAWKGGGNHIIVHFQGEPIVPVRGGDLSRFNQIR